MICVLMHLREPFPNTHDIVCMHVTIKIMVL